MVEGVASEVKKMAKKEATKGTVKNGRKSKDGMAYNANHNTLETTRRGQSHIDQKRLELNSYFQFKSDGSMLRIKGGHGGFDAKKHEKKIYDALYGEGLKARNERYTKTRHLERVRTIKDLYQDPKTAPLETIFQIGNSKDDMDPILRTNALTRAWAETVQVMQEKYGEHMKFLDAALHCDEAVDHIHCRVAFIGHDRHGFAVPSQNSALAAMGFERPDLDRPNSRYNNPTISFTDELRETFYQACERQGIKINREVQSYSQRQVEILEYKCDRYREENQALEQQAREARERAAAAEDRQQRAEEKTQAAQEALERVLGDTNTLKDEIKALRASQAALEAENERLTDKKDQTEKALEEVKAQGREVVAQNKQLREENKTLEDKNQKLENRQGKLEARLEEVTAQGIEISTKNKELRQANDQLTEKNKQLQEEIKQLQAEVDSLEMQLAQLRDSKAAAERETERAKADRAAALEAAQKLEKYQKQLFERQNSRLVKQYGTLEPQKEKKNLRGQVTQEARPECVIVCKKDLERVEDQARYNIHVHLTDATIKELDKKISENEIIQSLQSQVEQQQREITSLRVNNERKGQKLQDREWAVEQYENTLQMYGLGQYILGDRNRDRDEPEWK